MKTKVLIIEDDENKRLEVQDVVVSFFDSKNCELTIKRSYREGLYTIKNLDYDLLILDMSLPSYDISKVEKGGRRRPFGGREILSQIKRRKISLQVVVITQFPYFEEKNNVMMLSDLKLDLKEKFKENYLGTIFYSAVKSEWRSELVEILRKIVPTKDK